MLQGFMGKVMAGLLSMSALMFNSYVGNEPVFLPLQCRAGQNYLLVRATLDNAFDNDFSDVFKCGKPINLWYKIEIKHENNTVYSSNFRHTVTYNPMNAAWELFKSENSQKDIYTDYHKLITEISALECSVPRDVRWKSVQIRAEAWLPEIELTKPNRKVDLMMLWKLKRPTTKTTFTLAPTS